MTDIEVKSKEVTAPLPETAKEPATEQTAAASGIIGKAHKRQKSAGEQIVERGIYTGIGFGANEVGSLVFTGVLERGSGRYFGKRGFEAAADWLVKTFPKRFSDKMKDGKPALDFKGRPITGEMKAKNLLTWAALNFIGTVIVYPMKKLKDNKESIVKSLNHRIDHLRGNKMSAEEIAARDAEVERAIACEPKQTWPTILIGRAAGMLVAIGGWGYLLGPERNDKIKGASDKIFTWGARKGGMKKLADAKEDHWFHYYSRLIGIETMGCATTSLVLEIVSKLVAKKKPDVRNPELCEAAHTAPPASEDAPPPADHKKIEHLRHKRPNPAEKPPPSQAERLIAESGQSLQPGLG